MHMIVWLNITDMDLKPNTLTSLKYPNILRVVVVVVVSKVLKYGFF